MIMSVILMTALFYKALILQGEITRSFDLVQVNSILKYTTLQAFIALKIIVFK